MISEDEYLERVVAGIQRAADDRSDVRWNEIINGRQFDVVVRFTLASLSYLVLFEVKNRKRKAEAQDIEAFVTKSNDHGANKAVFVNVAGFQSGAEEVARKHGIELFTVSFDESVVELPSNPGFITIENFEAPLDPPNLVLSEPTNALNVSDIELRYSNGKKYLIPNEPTQAAYYLNRTRLPNGKSLVDIVASVSEQHIRDDEERVAIKKISPPKQIRPPDEYFFPAGKLKAIKCKLCLVEARILSGNTRIDPAAFRHPVVYKNVFTEEALVFRLDQLPLGDRVVQRGCFYFQLHPLRYFYCENIENQTVAWTMVESFQHAELFQAEFTQSLEYSLGYIPVRDKKTVARLEKRLRKLQR